MTVLSILTECLICLPFHLSCWAAVDATGATATKELASRPDQSYSGTKADPSHLLFRPKAVWCQVVALCRDCAADGQWVAKPKRCCATAAARAVPQVAPWHGEPTGLVMVWKCFGPKVNPNLSKQTFPLIPAKVYAQGDHGAATVVGSEESGGKWPFWACGGLLGQISGGRFGEPGADRRAAKYCTGREDC